MPAAQAGGTRAAEQRAVLPARPSGPAPVLGDAGRARGVQSRRKTRFASAGRVVRLARCGEVASPWHASMHGGQSRPFACCSAPDQGWRKIHFIHSEITDSHLAIIVLKARWDPCCYWRGLYHDACRQSQNVVACIGGSGRCVGRGRYGGRGRVVPVQAQLRRGLYPYSRGSAIMIRRRATVPSSLCTP